MVQPRGSYFFHTGFGKNESIRVDLGRRHRVRRIEVTNRQGGFQERAKHIFAVLTEDGSGQGVRRVFPMYETGRLPGGAWQECGIDVPDVTCAVRHDHLADEHRAPLLGPEDLRRRPRSTDGAVTEMDAPAGAPGREAPPPDDCARVDRSHGRPALRGSASPLGVHAPGRARCA